VIVHVHPDSSITLDDPDRFDAFSVRAPDRDVPQIVAAFRGDAVAADDEHVWISIARLHALGEQYGGADWRAGCDGMLDYASRKGWVDESRRRVRAHLERG